MESLRQKQSRFCRQSARLILKAFELGYEATYGETERKPAQAALNAANGSGISNSLHLERLAIDLNLFKNGRYIEDEEGHRELGTWWKTFGPEYKWGGDFKRKDFNHYSLSPDGVRA